MKTEELGEVGRAINELAIKFPGEEVSVWTVRHPDGQITFTGYVGSTDTSTYCGSGVSHPSGVVKYLSENHSASRKFQMKLEQLKAEKEKIENQISKLTKAA